MQLPPTIYAILVAIDDYPNPRHQLEGCVKDAQSMWNYLKSFSKDYEYNLKVIPLYNKDASRKGIIDAFEHFQQAKDNDICLFHYSGHGARLPVPNEFKYLESDGYLETIVCHDSRQSDGFDLVDKELSWLIWNTTKNKKNLHFVSIMDCCHSGKIVRSQIELDEIGLPREVTPNTNIRPIEDLLGFEDYTKVSENQYTPRHGRHILLAASRDNQTAKEVYINNERRGIFTYCLIDALKKAQGQITYSTLINKVRLRIRNIVKAQSPQILATIPTDKNRYFLTGKNRTSGKQSLAYWDKNAKEWRVNIGDMYGMLTKDINVDELVFSLLNQPIKLKAKKIFANYTVVHEKDELEKAKVYPVQLTSQPTSPILVGLKSERGNQGIDFFKQTLKELSSTYFSLTDNSHEASYLVHIEKNVWSLKNSANLTVPIFPSISNPTNQAIIHFVNDLETIFRWINNLEIQHLDTRIREDELEIQLYKVLDYDATNDNSPAKLIDWQQPNNFPYTRKHGNWEEPSFRLCIRNVSHRKLWVSVCYFGADFSIQNNLLDIQELQPNEETWAFLVDKDGHRTRTIPLWIDDYHSQNGKTYIEEYLKLFICTEEFSTDHFNQDGLPSKSPTRGFGSTPRIKRPDWTTREILLSIEWPELGIS